MSGAGPLLVRADASAAMGTGHLMRCLALVQAWRDRGGSGLLATHCDIAALLERFAVEGVEILQPRNSAGSAAEVEEILALAAERRVDWMVLDGYQFDADYLARLAESKTPLLVIDDNGQAGRYRAQMVLDQNITANESCYRERGPQTRLLLGARYALLRREFRQAVTSSAVERAGNRNLLVTMGGSDPDNVMEEILRALAQQSAELEIRAVVGAGNHYGAQLQAVCKRTRASMQLESDVTNMAELMAWADLAITAAGTTLWELAGMGVPALTVALVEHQRLIAAAYAKSGAGIDLGWHEDINYAKLTRLLQELQADKSRLAAMRARSRELVDGRGAERVAEAMLEHRMKK